MFGDQVILTLIKMTRGRKLHKILIISALFFYAVLMASARLKVSPIAHLTDPKAQNEALGVLMSSDIYKTIGNGANEDLPIRIIVIQTNPDHYWCSCARINMEDYAKKHSYELSWETGSRTNNYALSGDPIASKMMKFRQALDAMSDSRLVVLMDCDIFVTNPTISIESIWSQWSTPTTSLILSRDAHWNLGVPVNSGMMIMKPSTFSATFINSIIEDGRLDKMYGNLFNGDTLVDQPRVTVNLLKFGQLNEVPTSDTEFHEYVTIVSQRVMNAFYRLPESYFSGAHKDPEDTKWKEGDFVAHITGMNPENRVKAAKKFGNGCPGIVDKTKGMVYTTDGENIAT